ncbi:hypothetical protein DIPPA_32045 [Diplonema papillatum]|nr:hypothetical protein DIPPA_32045 [Diplonema papillatum]
MQLGGQDDTAAAAAATNPLQKRKVQHDAVLMEFEQRIRKDGLDAEALILDTCTKLKHDLVSSCKEIRAWVPAACTGVLKAVQAGLLHGDDPTGQSDASAGPGTPSNGVDHEPSVQNVLVVPEALARVAGGRDRKKRILGVKHRLQGIYARILESTRWRLTRIEEFSGRMLEINRERKAVIERTLATLLVALRTVGWADDEKCSVVIQHKGADMNINIAANVSTVADLANRLHIRELEIETDLLKEFDQYWQDVLESMLESCLLWLGNRLTSPAYQHPPERSALVDEILKDLTGREFCAHVLPPAGTHREKAAALEHALAAVADQPLTGEPPRYEGCVVGGFNHVLRCNLSAVFDLVKSLASVRKTRGGRSDAARWPFPGGSEQGGWLEFWRFAGKPTAESLQWGRVVPERVPAGVDACGKAEHLRDVAELFLHRLSAFHAQYLSRALQKEESLNDRAARDCRLIVADLKTILLTPDYEQPTPLPTPTAASLEDVMGSTVSFSACSASSNSVTYTHSHPHPDATAGDGEAEQQQQEQGRRVLSVTHAAQETQWGPVRALRVALAPGGDGGGEGGEEVVVVHRFFAGGSWPGFEEKLHELLDTRCVRHNFSNAGLLRRHAAECDRLIATTGELQAQLVAHVSATDETPDEADPSHPPRLLEAIRQARALAAPRIASLHQGSAVFLQHLDYVLTSQAHSFGKVMLHQPTSLIPNVKGAGLFLAKATDAFSAVISAHEREMTILSFDFEDGHAKRETLFSSLVQKLKQSPDKAQTAESFKQALAVLQDVEAHYVSVAKEQKARLALFKANVKACEQSLADELCTALHVDLQPGSTPQLQPAESSSPRREEGDAGDGEGRLQIPFTTPAGTRAVATSATEHTSLGSLDDRRQPARPAPVDEIVLPMHPILQDADRAAIEKELAEAVPQAVAVPATGKAGKAAAKKQEKAKDDIVEAVRCTDDELFKRHQQRIDAVKQNVALHLGPLKLDVFALQTAYRGVLEELRGHLIDWLLSFARELQAAVEAHCDEEDVKVEAWLSEKLRLHQRRMPQLASQEYDQRTRELVEADEMKLREFTWIGKRFSAALGAAANELGSANEVFKRELDTYAAKKLELPAITNIPAITVHRKSVDLEHDTLGAKCAAVREKVNAMLDKAHGSLVKEGARFLLEHCKTFAEGGTLSEEEQQKNKRAIEETERESLAAVETQRKAVDAAVTAQLEKLAQEKDRYAEALRHNDEDLSFLRWVGERLSALKMSVTSLLAESSDAEKRLEAAVQELEAHVKAQTLRDTAEAHTSLFADRDQSKRPKPANSPHGTAGNDGGSDDPAVAVTELTIADIDNEVSTLLRKAKLSGEAKIRDLPASRLLACLDDVSKLLYARGLFLGALDRELPFAFVNPQTYVSPAAQDAPAAGEEAEEGWSRFLQTQPVARRLEAIAAQFWVDAEPAVRQYYQAIQADGRSATRPQIGSTEQLQRDAVARKVDAICAVATAHVEHVTSDYKRQAMRVSLALPRAPLEIFTSLYNNAFASLGDSAGGCKRLFDGLYEQFLAVRKAHQACVKTSMVNPGNRGVLAETQRREKERYEKCVAVIKQLWGIALREEVAARAVLVQQLAQSAATAFRIMGQMVTPDMVRSATDIVVGSHKSLKRLKIAKLRAENQGQSGEIAQQQQQQQQQPASGKGKAADAKPAKPAAKGGGGGAGKKEAKDAKPDVTDTRPQAAYPGMTVDNVSAFKLYLAAHPDVAVAEHLGKDKADASSSAPPPAGKADAKKDAKKGGKQPAAAPADDAEVITMPQMEGPDLPLFRTVVQARDNTQSFFAKYHKEQTERVEAYFQGLLHSEDKWFANWEELLDSLVPQEQPDK